VSASPPSWWTRPTGDPSADDWWAPLPSTRRAAPSAYVGRLRHLPPTWTLLALATAVAAVLGGAIGGALVHAADGVASAPPHTVNLGSPSSGEVVVRAPGSVAAVAAKILPSVVSIDVHTAAGADTGSGIVISTAGYILTNNHFFAGASAAGQVSVVLPDEQQLTGEVVGRDPVSDLAVVRIVGVRGLRAATLGSSASLAVGDPVVAVGSPLGLAGTVTSGIVSALDRPVEAGDGQSSADDLIDAIQTDAAINPGNSGGPLVDMSGAVVGVNSAIATLSGSQAFSGSQSGSIGLGFAIPIDQAKRIAAQIIAHGYATHAVIGVRLDPTYTGRGARIGTTPGGGQAVDARGPAARAGLRAGDVIIAVGGEVVTTPDELIVAIRKHAPGERLVLTFLRDGRRMSALVVLGAQRS
jgi:putative serine protease PepD